VLRSRREKTLTMVLPLTRNFIFAVVKGNSQPSTRFGTRLHRQEASSRGTGLGRVHYCFINLVDNLESGAVATGVVATL